MLFDAALATLMFAANLTWTVYLTAYAGPLSPSDTYAAYDAPDFTLANWFLLTRQEVINDV